MTTSTSPTTPTARGRSRRVVVLVTAVALPAVAATAVVLLRPAPPAPPEVALDHPAEMVAGEVHDGTVTLTFPAGSPVASGAPGKRVLVGAIGRGVPDDPPEGDQGAEHDALVLCSHGFDDVRSGAELRFPCAITAPPRPGPFDVTVGVSVEDDAGTTFEVVRTFQVVAAP